MNFNIFTSKNQIINPTKKSYKEEYDLGTSAQYGDGRYEKPLSLLDWALIDKLRGVSITGFGFETDTETIKMLKNTVLSEVESQRNFISDMKTNLNVVLKSPHLKNKVIEIIDTNNSKGFFYIKQLLSEYSKALKLHQMNDKIPLSIEDNIIKEKFKTVVTRDRFKRNLGADINDFQIMFNLFKSCSNLKLFNLNAIKTLLMREGEAERLYNKKEEKLKKKYEGFKTYKIKRSMINQMIDDYSNNNPPVIFPAMFGTIIDHVYTNFEFIVQDTPRVRKLIKKLRTFSARIMEATMMEVNSKNSVIWFRAYLRFYRNEEISDLSSIISNYLSGDIISAKQYLGGRSNKFFSRKDFYDLEREAYFYTKDLFSQFYNFVRQLLGDPLKRPKPLIELKRRLVSKNKSLDHLFSEVENRFSRENIDLSLKNLQALLSYNQNLGNILLDIDCFKSFKTEPFFKNYVQAIKFIPSFQSFGFGQYYLHFVPNDIDQFDFPHFLHNSFQSIKYPAGFDRLQPFLVKYIWPYQNPNDKTLNWLRSKGHLREYCLFFVKKVVHFFHINYNLDVKGWDLNPDRFKLYFQNILFNKDYDLTLPPMKEFNVGDLKTTTYFSPQSSEYEALTELYDIKPIDIKSHLGTRNYRKVNFISDLLERKLIYPFISFKNCGLNKKITLILPDLSTKTLQKLKKIFSFFNKGVLYEIEGEYYINGLDEVIKFESGLMIKLYLPHDDLNPFIQNFTLLFEYFDIKHYIIQHNVVSGENLLKSVFNNLDFLIQYNPLKNLIWNRKDKIWMNHKLFTQEFKKIYPELIPSEII